jgi:hypothetical protein
MKLPTFYLTTLDGYEILIMMHLLSNTSSFIINKKVIATRCKLPKNKFNTAWKSLEEKHHIKCERIQGGVKWTVYEDPKDYEEISTSDTDGTTENKPIKNTGGTNKNKNNKPITTACGITKDGTLTKIKLNCLPHYTFKEPVNTNAVNVVCVDDSLTSGEITKKTDI